MAINTTTFNVICKSPPTPWQMKIMDEMTNSAMITNMLPKLSPIVYVFVSKLFNIYISCSGIKLKQHAKFDRLTIAFWEL